MQNRDSPQANTSSDWVTTAPSMHPPDTDPTTSPLSLTAMTTPGSRGPEPIPHVQPRSEGHQGANNPRVASDIVTRYNLITIFPTPQNFPSARERSRPEQPVSRHRRQRRTATMHHPSRCHERQSLAGRQRGPDRRVQGPSREMASKSDEKARSIRSTLDATMRPGSGGGKYSP